ncbi:phosphotransferase family protein [Rhodopirellula sallentina]|uniref:Aminoglycoside phosphotransferase n=1 Tax=Rhodopirellula sallentina SM41 TaxID=1263870 RepID=M5U6H2_9BACT|nr:aminoglycoside phosphotransferase family protein [Rhodopirellula sallentina]EMI56864.1 aminoglycoside phosphotransferase [Rhodopirellula sallentina SM41]
MTTSFENMLRDRGFLQSQSPTLTPLTGGVSSEIYLVRDGDRRFVVKRALEKLKVQQDWFADTSRNQSEQAFMRYVAGFRPDAMPEIYRCDAEGGVFAMEYLDGFSNWKQDLLDGECDMSLARSVGELLGEIHATTWGDPKVAEQFDTIANFDQLRIDPYLRGAADKNPDLGPQLLNEAERLTKSRQCLIHGDYSPKNILHRDNRVVPLDCEVACYADAAFDFAFLINHLYLKSLYHAPRRLPLDAMIEEVRVGYREKNPSHSAAVEDNVATLLPMLMLARVDGKSPVEYLDSQKQSVIRTFARSQIASGPTDLDQTHSQWLQNLQPLVNE